SIRASTGVGSALTAVGSTSTPSCAARMRRVTLRLMMMTTLNNVTAITTHAHSPPLFRRERRLRARWRAADSRESAGGGGGGDVKRLSVYCTGGVLIRVVGSARGRPFAVVAAWAS